MEQKTEASQAVDEPMRADFEAWHRSNFATRHSTGQPTRDMHNGIYAEEYGPEHQQKMWEAWQASRAALKAQPAPTEAQNRPDFSKFATIEEWQAAMSKWSLNAALGKAPTESAQGEDSARLEFMMQQEAWIAWSNDGESCRVFHRDEEGDTGPIMGWIPEAWFHNPREAIDRARASAETGGVKP